VDAVRASPMVSKECAHKCSLLWPY